jgi:CheY-like chemotaxis protein
MRADSAFASIPIIMLTSYATARGTPEARAAGIRRVLTKPVRRAQLLDTVVAALRPEPEPGQAARRRGLRGPATPKPTSHARILVAEDNPVNQQLRARDAAPPGLPDRRRGNGQEAVESVMQVPYDLVLMDCQMPVMDGFEATKMIREREGRRGTRTSSRDGERDGRRSRALPRGGHGRLSREAVPRRRPAPRARRGCPASRGATTRRAPRAS